MPEHDDLLKRFQPVLRYDSNEQYFADSAAQFMVNPGNELRRKATSDGSGAVLASAVPKAGERQLSPDFLGPATYGDGSPVQDGDVIGVSGQDYAEQYRKLRIARPELNNHVYGHAVEANGRVWLQYWLWYFYNDYRLSFDIGLHEGDWEMVQYRMAADLGQPDIAVYAQHRYGEMREWDKIEKLADDPNRPVVYVARGSHASYFEAGFHQTEAWYDLADGKRRMPHRPTLDILGDGEPAWALWPGHWGDTMPRDSIESNSPTGPGAKKQWTRPDSMLDDPPAVSKKGEAPKAPDVTVTRASGRLHVEYDVSKRDPRPTTLVVTVNSKDEPGVPPHTLDIAVAPEGQGKVTTAIVLDPTKHYDVYTSSIAGDPPVPSESTLDEIVPFDEAKPALTTVEQVLGRVSEVVAKIRGDD